ncbi:MAG: hypothetical protein JSU70_09555 [Phycisphaerales bacterium]|nr:MAG: hypothetical protein JSU70_09555 [Phycisphaerales bacterium]
MKGANVVCAVAVLLMAGMASAATVWNPAANGIFPPATADWGVAANWTNDVPGVADGKAVFNVPDAAECVVTDAQSFNQFVQGDNGPGGVIRVMDGGSLTTGAVWSAVGYNNTAHMIVETGGSVTFGEHMWVGLQEGGPGTLDIIGGSIRVSEMTGLGWDNGTGFVNVIAGLLDLHNLHPTDSIKEGSVMDVRNGIVTIDGDHAWKIDDYVAAGRIVGFDGQGTVNADFDVRNAGKTTVTAVHPLEPFPSTEGSAVPPGEVTLSWTLPDPCVPGQQVPVDVYFTDDYYALKEFEDPASIRVVRASNVTSVTVTAVGQTRYYWAVDAYVGSATDPVYGPIFSFWVGNQAPAVEISADPPAAWLPDGNDVSLDGTVTDDVTENPATTWSVVAEPNENTAIFATPTEEDTIVSFKEVGVYTLRLTADDGEPADNIGTAEITIEVFENSCEAAKSLPDFVPIPGDLDADCKEDFLDFAIFADGWLDCNALDCGE